MNIDQVVGKINQILKHLSKYMNTLMILNITIETD